MDLNKDSSEPPSVDKTSSHISLYRPFDKDRRYAPRDKLKLLPKWMELLPCSRNAHIKPPPPSKLTHLILRPSESDPLGTPYFTPPDFIFKHRPELSVESELEIRSNDVSPCPDRPPAQPSRRASTATLTATTQKQAELHDRDEMKAVADKYARHPNPFVRRYDMGYLQPRRLRTHGASSQPLRDQVRIQSANQLNPKVSFFAELSVFLASRERKLVLPSRARENPLHT